MRLAPMRYKDYTWPHNPEVYVVEHQRRMAVHPVPYGRCVVQDLGSTYRILRGEGVFAGENAYEQFQELVEVFRQEGAGILVHPVWQAENVWFVELTVTEEPLPDYVRYQFVFWEEWGGYDGSLTENDDGGTAPWTGGQNRNTAADEPAAVVYIVKKGDTLWGIARRYGVALTALIAANPQIKNPNLIYPGDRVTIP